jgi:tetratricopeptide (TPR) repeat protein
MRFKALSYYKLGKMDDAVEIYKSLCNVRRPDWWLLYEYAKALRDMGNKKEALKLMYCASNGNPTLKLMVTLFADIGMLCKEMGKNEEARAHFILCREIRKENQWSVLSAINDSISGLNRIIGIANEPASLKEALKVCRNEWNKTLGEKQSSVFKRDKDQKRINLIGRIRLGKDDRPFCFITDKNNETYFCLKSDLPHSINNGDEVIFNAIPSFDKKKNKESWKAVDIRKS